MKHKQFIIWMLLNILLPFTPSILKTFINYFSLTGEFSLAKIVEDSELIFYSITMCVIILNINLGEAKGGFEFSLKIFILIILILDFVLLSLSYGKMPLRNIENYLFVSVIFQQ